MQDALPVVALKQGMAVLGNPEEVTSSFETDKAWRKSSGDKGGMGESRMAFRASEPTGEQGRQE